MTIDSSDAASALAAVTKGQRRAVELRGYAGAGNILIAWGLVWLVCNLASFAGPSLAKIAWPIGIGGAVLFSVLGSRGRTDRRIFATVGALFAFVALLLAITGGDQAMQNTIVSLLVAASYIVLGIWTGARFAWVGLALSGMIVLGWFVFPASLHLWLAFGGGGALILAGLWLRRA